VGARSTPLPQMPFDGGKIITSRQAMSLAKQPQRLAIVGAGAIGCEFADFYNALGTQVTLIEMLPQILPNEDPDIALLLHRIFEKRGIDVRVKSKTERIESTAAGVRLTLSGEHAGTVEADMVLVAVGVTGNVENLAAASANLEIFKNRVKVKPDFRTSLEDVWAVGDCVALDLPGVRHPDLAHVAHHEAVHCVERIFGVSDHSMDYRQIPGCTYTHPQVASIGLTPQKAREAGYEIRIGKFPFSASGRALAAGEPDGFVKLVFDAKYGELLGAHMIGETVTELLAELVLARNLEATEDEIIDAMHPHPTYSEAIMEAAGASEGRAIHIA
jgi:dihydrolipoamide dehydrogenase